MVWDLMSANGVGDVVEIDGIMNADHSARFRPCGTMTAIPNTMSVQ